MNDRSSPDSAPMRQHSETAWNIASRYSAVLASETRDLAAAIDEALRGAARRADARTSRALDCDEFMPLSLLPLEKPNYDPGEHQVIDGETGYIFKLICSRERAERIVSVLNAAYEHAHAPAQAAPATDEMERLRDLLHEARQYVSDAGLGCEDDNEVKIHSEALLALIDQTLATPLSRPQQD